MALKYGINGTLAQALFLEEPSPDGLGRSLDCHIRRVASAGAVSHFAQFAESGHSTVLPRRPPRPLAFLVSQREAVKLGLAGQKLVCHPRKTDRSDSSLQKR